MTARRTWLVIGGEGAVGSAVIRHLEVAGTPVRATGRRDPALSFLDLAKLGDWAPGPDVAVVVVAAALSRLDTCENDPALAHRLNVEACRVIAERCAAHGVFPLFFSTNRVFDGTEPAPEITAETGMAPTAYGRSKADMERQLTALGVPLAILRLTKVLTADNPLLAGWCAALDRGEPLDAFADMPFAPVPIDLVCDGVRRIGEGRLAGIWHFSSPDELSYAEVAGFLAETLGADPALVRPVSVADSRIPPHFAPRHGHLGIAATAAATGLAFPDARQAIAQWLAFPRDT